MKRLAPIILFIYNRPKHTEETLEALAKNDLAKESDLFVFADGPKEGLSQSKKDKITATRKVVAKFENAFASLTLVERPKNYGLEKSIVSGVSEIVNEYDRVIVLEDDIKTSKGFLKYMNEALDLYKEDKSVMHIAGFFPKCNANLPETFFYNVTSCWGWATWKDAWSAYNGDANDLLEKLNTKGYSDFIYNGGQENLLLEQLTQNARGSLQTWAVKWHTSVFLKDGLSLHPKYSLVDNTGHDESGENSGIDNPYAQVDLHDYVAVERVSLKQEEKAYRAVAEIYKKTFKEKLVSMIPLYFKEKIKQLVNKETREKYLEKRRLFGLPRYQNGSSTLIGNAPFYFVDPATFIHGYEEIYEENIYNFKASSKNPLIIDCGSNIGLSVVYFKLAHPSAKLIAFEPDLNISKTLHKNIESFGLSNVEVHNAAIWTHNDGVEFQEEGGFSGRIPKPGDKINIVKADSFRLKDLLNQKVDFLKLDIEGAEFDVIKDCKDLLPNVEHLFIEYHSHINEVQNLHDILKIVTESGFRYHIHEAYAKKEPFVNNETMLGMDLQLNIYAKKEGVVS